ncbi:MAG: flagellar basal body-associated FliL family protein [Planctomycetota bacterium]
MPPEKTPAKPETKERPARERTEGGAKETPAAPSPPRPPLISSMGLALMGGAMVVEALLLAGFFWWFLAGRGTASRGGGGSAAEGKEGDKAPAVKIQTLEQFQVNVPFGTTPDLTKYLVTDIALKMDKNLFEEKKDEALLRENLPEIRNDIILFFRNKSYVYLADPKNDLAIREEIRHTINRRVGSGRDLVSQVFFNNYYFTD